jgi:hypothetical protein
VSTFETNLKNLKTLHAKYAAKVKKLAAQRDALAAKLADATDKEVQLAESIAVLENRPTLTKLITDSLAKPRMEPLPAAIGGGAALQAAPTSDLPPAEKGFKWAKNEMNEDVLIPENNPLTGQANPTEIAASIILPIVADDESFADTDRDLIQQ